MQTQASEELEVAEVQSRELVLSSQELNPIPNSGDFRSGEHNFMSQKIIANLELTILSYKRSIIDLENRLQ